MTQLIKMEKHLEKLKFTNKSLTGTVNQYKNKDHIPQDIQNRLRINIADLTELEKQIAEMKMGE